MSYTPIDHVFLYHAYALALGGWLKRDGRITPIDNVAPSSLSVIGGYGSAAAYNVNFAATTESPVGDGGPKSLYIHVGHAYTEVRGVEDESENPLGLYKTTVRSVIDDFRINDVVSIEHAEAVLVSRHEKPDKNGNKPEGKVHVGQSNMSGLSVDGKHVDLQKHDLIDDEPTYGAMRDQVDAYLNSTATPAPAGAAATTAIAPSLQWAAQLCDCADLRGPAPGMPDYVRDLAAIKSATHLRYSLFKGVDAPGLDAYKSSIQVPGFGRIFLGEIFASRGMKQLNMIRINLGCDTCGDLTGGGGSTNGESMP